MKRRAEWTARALKDLKQLDRLTSARIIAAAVRFAETGYGDVRRVKGTDEFALRVGDWRVFFDPPTVEAVRYTAVRPRGRAYRPS